jgi:flagellar motor switch protein FliN
MILEAQDSSASKFCQLWAESIAAVLQKSGISEAKGIAIPLTADPSETPATSSTAVAARFSLAGAVHGELLCFAESATALRLAQALKSEPLQPDAAFGEEQKDAFVEFLRQAADLTASGWKQSAGTEILLSYHPAAEPLFPPSRVASITCTGTNFPEITLKLYLTSELVQSIAACSAAAPAEVAGHSSTAAQDPDADRRIATSGNLDLLMEVELEATIRFGEREMRLREVLALMPGAVIELDQLVNEPAELLVAGRMVARGEVVVVDGNFGIRVTEVVSPNQRASLVALG